MLMVIDWECAPLTKPDKPLLAFATMLKWYPQLEARVMPYILKFNLFDEVAINQAVEYQLCSCDEAKQIAQADTVGAEKARLETRFSKQCFGGLVFFMVFSA